MCIRDSDPGDARVRRCRGDKNGERERDVVLAKRCDDVVVHAAVSPEVLMVLNGPARRACWRVQAFDHRAHDRMSSRGMQAIPESSGALRVYYRYERCLLY